MKKLLFPYLISYLFLAISYLFVSLMMTIFFSFIHVSSLVYQIILYLINYLILACFTFFFFYKVKEKPGYPGLILAFSYLFIQILFHFNEINLMILIKPLWILGIYYLLFFLKKKQQ